jgi:hypothetical protein
VILGKKHYSRSDCAGSILRTRRAGR